MSPMNFATALCKLAHLLTLMSEGMCESSELVSHLEKFLAKMK